MIYLANISEEGGGGHRGCGVGSGGRGGGGCWIPQCFTGVKHGVFHRFGPTPPCQKTFEAALLPFNRDRFIYFLAALEHSRNSSKSRRSARGPDAAPCVSQSTACGSAVLEICKRRRGRVHLNARRAPPCSRVLPWNYTACSEITHDTHSSLPRLTSCTVVFFFFFSPGTGPSQTISSQYLHEACETMGIYRPPFC